jgi:hypothetical protein
MVTLGPDRLTLKYCTRPSMPRHKVRSPDTKQRLLKYTSMRFFNFLHQTSRLGPKNLLLFISSLEILALIFKVVMTLR